MRALWTASTVERTGCSRLLRVRIQHRYVTASVGFVLLKWCSCYRSSLTFVGAGLAFILNVNGVFHLFIRLQLLPIFRIINFSLKIGSGTAVRTYKLRIGWR